MESVDCVVVGAGVVGLAVARALALAGRETLVLESEANFGSVTSSRNSEVIHAGLYYPKGSLKARLCIEGRERLYAFCAERRVPHRRCGKLIVATAGSQLSALAALADGARGEGVRDLTWVERTELGRLEPDLAGIAAVRSPSTGIVDSHALMLALLGEAEAHGAMLARGAAVGRLARQGGSWRVWAEGMDEPIAARCVVNAAGLAAQALAHVTEGLDPDRIPPLHLAKGVYFTYAGRTPFRRLIYPMPEPGGLGVHLTLDLAGQARFGPDVEWVERIDYGVDPARRGRFAAAIAAYWPGVDAERLSPGYAGVRPKLSGPGEPAADFVISGPADHGLDGLVNLFGIESPGLTASLAIADRVAAALA